MQTKSLLDYEDKSGYSVTVSVHDGKNEAGSPDMATDDTINVTITITDLEEAGSLTLSSVQPQVDTELTATLADPDGSVTGITWEWQRASNQATWDPINGATTADYTPVNADVGKHLRVTASYADGHGPSKETRVVSDNPVQEAPVSNNAPAFSTETAERNIVENTEAGEDIGAPVLAADAENDTLTYSLSGTDDDASFGIVQATGQLQTKAALDYESDKKSYTVTVTATDPSGLSDTIKVTITVTDEDERPVVTVIPTVYYAENGSSPIATYTATDPETGTITWSLSGDDSGDFSISNDGELTFKHRPTTRSRRTPTRTTNIW